uniref:Phytase-like domain-containing protein n=1 Tax=Panagrolaimus superbus TaxID=310955 RepID=A0A914YH74_9BILA
MRRSNTSSRRTGIVGIAGSKRDYFLAGETGAIWSLNADSLIVQPIGNDSDGIEQLYTSLNGFIAVTPEKEFKSIAKDAITSEYFLAGHKTTSDICFRDSLILFIDTVEATNAGPLLGYDLIEESLVLREDSQKYLAIDINEESEVVAFNSKYEIDIFQFAD